MRVRVKCELYRSVDQELLDVPRMTPAWSSAPQNPVCPKPPAQRIAGLRRGHGLVIEAPTEAVKATARDARQRACPRQADERLFVCFDG